MKEKTSINNLALLGGTPLFDSFLHVGQMNFPDWKDFEKEMQGIFDRRFFTNHGPKVNDFEHKLAEYLGVRHAICMTNGTIALSIAARALELTGEVIVPAFTFIATVQSLVWAGLTPVFCDVHPDTHTITPDLVREKITKNTSAVAGVHLWGKACDIDGLSNLAKEKGLSLFFDAAHAVGCSYKGKKIACFGDVEVFSMHATKVLNTAEGGFATTNNDEIADNIRTIRNFHNAESFEKAPVRVNAKMSEAQAVMGLLSLQDFEKNCEHNKKLYTRYLNCLSHLQGIDIVQFDTHETNNYQYLILDINPEQAGLTRDQFVSLLEAENILARRYFTPGAHRTPPFNKLYPQFVDSLPVTDALSSQLMQLPVGQSVSTDDVEKICSFIKYCSENCEKIRTLMDKIQSTTQSCSV